MSFEQSPRVEQSESAEPLLEQRLKLRKQYESLFVSLNTSGILELLPEKEALGVVGIDGKEYPIPEYETVVRIMQEQEPRLKEKIAQGFVKLQMTPIAMPLIVLKDRVAQIILKHYQEKKLFAQKRNPDDPDIPLELNTDQPLYMWDTLITADTSEKLIYYPKAFQHDHGGLTKMQLLEQSEHSPFPGWNVVLLEDLAFLPQENKGQVIGGRSSEILTSKAAKAIAKTWRKIILVDTKDDSFGGGHK